MLVYRRPEDQAVVTGAAGQPVIAGTAIEDVGFAVAAQPVAAIARESADVACAAYGSDAK